MAILRTALTTPTMQRLSAAALAWLLCAGGAAWAGSTEQPPADSRKHDSAEESHTVRDALATGADKVGGALKKGADAVGPAIDRGVTSAKKAVEKSAEAVGTAVKKTSKKIEDKLGTSSADDKPAKSGAR
jgi:hypothetical protein